jgi:small subunit ribosomal protein S14
MTTSSYKKAFKQLKVKPNKIIKYNKHNAPKKRSCGRATKVCKVTGRVGGHVGKYGIGLCRQAFRQYATKLGFKKYN